jgi:uncharacterized membrane protein HdeD (DUF308 family)
MNYEERNKGRGLERFQATMHLGMGIFYILIGLLIVYVKYFGSMELPTTLAYVLGSLMIIYGIFRLWRGIVALKQKNSRR